MELQFLINYGASCPQGPQIKCGPSITTVGPFSDGRALG